MVRTSLILFSSLALLSSCSDMPTTAQTQTAVQVASTEKAFSSAVATLLVFDFEVELVSPGTPWNVKQAMQDYLLYTMGHLNQNDSVGRLDAVTLSNITSESLPDGVHTRARVKMPVAWGSKDNLPTTYAFTLPRLSDWNSLETFAKTYGPTCAEWGHDVTAGDFWYYYRPNQRGCSFAESDVTRIAAAVSVSTENTTGKYPELHKVWEDGTLSVIAVFGKYEDGATSSGDAGISAYNEFVGAARRAFGQGLVTEPADLQANPGVAFPDVTLRQTLPDGRKVVITALLVDNVRATTGNFDARYNALSADADLIAYNGHAGLGSNVRALVRKGTFVKGKYQIFFMNGCDTFAYVDGALAQVKASLNPDDPNGTKYLDMLTNAMPSYFHANSENMITLTQALKNKDAPQSYERIFGGIDSSQVVVVTGEEDNVFEPGMGTGQPAFEGHEATFDLAQGEEWRYESPVLPAGAYTFDLNGTGDADLYVRAGGQATTAAWDCRPYLGGSAERCVVNVTAATTVSVLVKGYALTSTLTFTAKLTR
jgi:hypothetical protein